GVPTTGAAAADAFARELARTAEGRRTVLVRASATPDLEWPTVRGERPDHVRLDDGRVARVLALNRWPATVTPDWLGPLAASCAAVSVYLRPLPVDVAQRWLRRRLTAVATTLALDDAAGRLPDPELSVAAEAATALRNALARGRTTLLHVQVLCGLAAADVDELDVLTAAAHGYLAGRLATARPVRFDHGPGWRALALGAEPLRTPWRCVDAATAAATLPHPVGPTGTGRGVLVGMDPSCGAPLLVDRFAVHNPTRLVVGTSGAGKSYAVKLEVARQRAAGVPVSVVDPEGEFGMLGRVLGGCTLEVGEEPCGLDPVGLACLPALSCAEGLAVLATWAGALLGAALSPTELALLDRALGVLRAGVGEGLSPGGSSPGAASPGAPSVADLLALIGDVAAHPPFLGSDLSMRLAPAASGSLAGLFAPNPELAHPPDLVVFDLRAVATRVRPAVMACVLAWAWTQAQAAGRSRRRLVVVDEAHLLLDDPGAAELLAQFARRARKYGLGLDVVTQRLGDFLGHPHGEAVLANAATKLVLGCEDHERAAVAAGLGLTAAESALLRPGVPGRGLLLTPELRTAVQVVAAPEEQVLAASGPRQR
ncbi:MAG TPA: hypothetical protein VNE21_07770, partial [Mycobacteriales bacterium]|nr:hypothetical protein [Mycobacteriales bacterium]